MGGLVELDRILIEDRIKILLGVAREVLLLSAVAVLRLFTLPPHKLRLALEPLVVQILERVVFKEVQDHWTEEVARGLAALLPLQRGRAEREILVLRLIFESGLLGAEGGRRGAVFVTAFGEGGLVGEEFVFGVDGSEEVDVVVVLNEGFAVLGVLLLQQFFLRN